MYNNILETDTNSRMSSSRIFFFTLHISEATSENIKKIMETSRMIIISRLKSES